MIRKMFEKKLGSMLSFLYHPKISKKNITFVSNKNGTNLLNLPQ